MNQYLKIHISLVLLLWCTSMAMGQIKVIDNKGSFKQIDTSKWTSSGLNIFNKNSGNVGIGLGNPTAKLHTMGLLKFDGLPYGAQTDSLLMLFGGNVRKLSFGDINYFWRLGGNNPSSGASLGSLDSDLPIISNGSLGITLKADANAIVGNKIDHTLGSNNNSNLSLTSVVNNTKQTIDNDNYENIFIGGIDKTVNNHHILTLGTELNDFQNNANLFINQDVASLFQNNNFVIANGNKFSEWYDNSKILANGEGIQMKDVNVAEVFGTGSISGQGDAVLLIDNGSINTKLSHIGGQDSYINSIGGNLGIGNDNPQRKLHLTGDLRFEGLNINTIDTSILTSAANGDITKRSINSILGSNAWTLLGNTGTNANNFLGTKDDVEMTFKSNNTTMFQLGRREKLGLWDNSSTGLFPYNQQNGSAAYVRGIGGVSSLQFEASSAAFYKPIFFTDSNGNFKMRGSAAGTDFFELGSDGTSNGGRLTFTIGDDGNEPIVFQKFNYTTSTNIEMLRLQGTGLNNTVRAGINVAGATPNSTLQVIGSVSESVTVITATTILNDTHNKIVLNNGATNITVTLPDALTCLGRKYQFSRYDGSTGTVTIQGTGTNQIQALAGTVGATTSIGSHTGAGAGLTHSFTAVSIGGGGIWVRL